MMTTEWTLKQEEVESIHLMSMSEIFDRLDRGEKIAPDSIYACKENVKFIETNSPSTARPYEVDLSFNNRFILMHSIDREFLNNDLILNIDVVIK